MYSHTVRVLCASVVLLLASNANTLARADQIYQVVDLGTFAGDGQSYFSGLNNRGEVVFRTDHGFHLYSGGRLSNITEQFPHGVTGIDDAGRVYGYPDTAVSRGGTELGFGAREGAFVRDAAGTRDIQITQAYNIITQKTQPVGITELRAINDRGQFIGSVIDDFGARSDFVYANGMATVVPNASAFGINNSGLIAGGTVNGAAIYRVENGKLTDLQELGQPGTLVYGVNDYGQVVGSNYLDPTGITKHAFLYQDGRFYDLNDLIPHTTDLVLNWSRAINDRGEIAVQGRIGDIEHAILLVPVPEPPSDVLFLTAMVMCYVGIFFRVPGRQIVKRSARQRRITHLGRSHPPSLHPEIPYAPEARDALLGFRAVAIQD
jgi:probable HAF family extracellular repeat protein